MLNCERLASRDESFFALKGKNSVRHPIMRELNKMLLRQFLHRALSPAFGEAGFGEAMAHNYIVLVSVVEIRSSGRTL